MQDKLILEFLGDAKPKGRPRVCARGGFARAYTPAKTVAAEKAIRTQLKDQLPSGWIPYDCALKATVVFYKVRPKHLKKGEFFPMRRPDLDNCLKLVWDALDKIVYVDDARIVEVHAKKVFGLIPKTTITFEKV